MLCSLRSRWRCLARDDRGAALVEFAIVLPVLMMLLLGIAEVGRAMWYHHIISEGVRDGVRYLSRMPLTGTFIGQAQNMALTGSPVGGNPRISTWTSPGSITVAVSNVSHGGAYNGPDPLQVITMTANVSFSFPLLGFMGIGPNLTISATDQQRHIGR